MIRSLRNFRGEAEARRETSLNFYSPPAAPSRGTNFARRYARAGPSFSEIRQISGFLEDRGRTMLKSQTNYRRRCGAEQSTSPSSSESH
jgi:hypothetical protein